MYSEPPVKKTSAGRFWIPLAISHDSCFLVCTCLRDAAGLKDAKIHAVMMLPDDSFRYILTHSEFWFWWLTVPWWLNKFGKIWQDEAWQKVMWIYNAQTRWRTQGKTIETYWNEHGAHTFWLFLTGIVKVTNLNHTLHRLLYGLHVLKLRLSIHGFSLFFWMRYFPHIWWTWKFSTGRKPSFGSEPGRFRNGFEPSLAACGLRICSQPLGHFQ